MDSAVGVQYRQHGIFLQHDAHGLSSGNLFGKPVVDPSGIADP